MSTLEDNVFTSSNNKLFKATSLTVVNRASFKWRIEDFLMCDSGTSVPIYSPWFNCSAVDWRLSLYPDASKLGFPGYAYVKLNKLPSKTDITADFKIGFNDKDGDDAFNLDKREVFRAEGGECSSKCLIPRSCLFQEEKKYVCDGVLTIYCQVAVQAIVHGGVRIMATDNVAFGSSVPNGLQTLSKDLDCLLREQRNCDVTLLVGDEKFSAHKWLLGARSSVFAAMFEHDMEESRSKVVSITDIDSAVMRDLLHYIYSGNVRELYFEKALGLYTAADKYALLELKDHCADFLSDNLSVDNACDLALLADARNDGKMLDSVKHFARENNSFLSTEKWKSLEQQNSLLAYEITLDLALK